MAFDDLAKSVASTLSGVFGATLPYTQPGYTPFDVRVVIRKDIETLDEQGQVVGHINTARIAYNDISIVPARGDYVTDGAVRYTFGKRLADDGYAYLFEVTT